jgi:hypothetical protein
VTQDPAPDLARAIPCWTNTGVLDNQGNKVLLPARIYVDNALMLATSKENMKQVLAALIEAIFVVITWHFSSSMQPSYGQVGNTPRCSYTNNAGTHHQHQQDDC